MHSLVRPVNSSQIPGFSWFSSSIQNKTDNDAINKIAGSDVVWIGLHREKEWSDGSNSLFRDWASGQPGGAFEQCVSADVTDQGRWSAVNCSLLLNFICYRTSNTRWITKPIHNNMFCFCFVQIFLVLSPLFQFHPMPRTSFQFPS